MTVLSKNVLLGLFLLSVMCSAVAVMSKSRHHVLMMIHVKWPMGLW